MVEVSDFMDQALMAPGLLIILLSMQVPPPYSGMGFVVGIVVLLASDFLTVAWEQASNAPFKYLRARTRSKYGYYNGKTPEIQFKYRDPPKSIVLPDGTRATTIKLVPPFPTHPRLGAVERIGIIHEKKWASRVTQPSGQVKEKGLTIDSHAVDCVTLWEIPYHEIYDEDYDLNMKGKPWYELKEATGDFEAEQESKRKELLERVEVAERVLAK